MRMLRREPRQERSQQRLNAILDATAALIVLQGYDTLTTNAIAEASGVSIGSIYQYFSNKQGIVEALAHRYLQEMQSVNLRAFDLEYACDEMTIEEIVARAVEPFVQFELANPAFSHLILAQDIIAELGPALASLDEMILANIRQLVTALAPHLSPSETIAVATISKAAVKTLTALVAATDDPAEREQLLFETKTMLASYMRARQTTQS